MVEDCDIARDDHSWGGVPCSSAMKPVAPNFT